MGDAVLQALGVGGPEYLEIHVASFAWHTSKGGHFRLHLLMHLCPMDGSASN